MEKIRVDTPADLRAATAFDPLWGMPSGHGQIFTDDFMQRYTAFDSYTAMLDAWGKKMQMAAKSADLADPGWIALVESSTRFKSFRDMLVRATAEWMAAQES